MALRILAVSLPEGRQQEVGELLNEFPIIGKWEFPLTEKRILSTFLVPAEQVEPVTDKLEQRFSSDETFRLVLLPVEATLPHVEEKEQKEVEDETGESEAQRSRVSREEIYHDIDDACKITPVFFATIVLSTVVATVGLTRDNMAATIGAMVIAPLLGPNAALSLATTLADRDLARRAIKASAAGVGLAFSLAALLGLILPVDPSLHELATRSVVSLADIGLALAAGVAGSLAFTSGVSTALVGVMVAVALLPPTVACGLFTGAGHLEEALGALILLTTNVVSFNLAGVSTFVVLGIRPRSWWKKERARKASRIALLLWLGLLIVLALLIYFAFDA